MRHITLRIRADLYEAFKEGDREAGEALNCVLESVLDEGLAAIEEQKSKFMQDVIVAAVQSGANDTQAYNRAVSLTKKLFR